MWYWYLLAVVSVVLDQVSKYLADSNLSYARPVEILPVFDLTLVYNKGAAFSFLSDAGGWQRWLFTAVSAVVTVVLIVWIKRIDRKQVLLAASLSLILGGAVGNLIDRVVFGYVIDFISVHWEEYYFPAFNIADAAITVGTGFMLLDVLLQSKNSPANS
jgi:signal peptidase II